jgi:hypothetical protein
MEKLNCWEVMKCGLVPGTKKAKKYGTCIATIEQRLDGVNSGKNGGRACWALIGTLCPETGIPKEQKTYSQKLKRCIQCRFYELVAVQEGADFKNTKEIVKILDGQSR